MECGITFRLEDKDVIHREVPLRGNSVGTRRTHAYIEALVTRDTELIQHRMNLPMMRYPLIAVVRWWEASQLWAQVYLPRWEQSPTCG